VQDSASLLDRGNAVISPLMAVRIDPDEVKHLLESCHRVNVVLDPVVFEVKRVLRCLASKRTDHTAHRQLAGDDGLQDSLASLDAVIPR